MITHSTYNGRDITREYTMGDRSWGKYDSGFHAWLVERVEADDWQGDTGYGGAVLYGRFVDYWDSCGFHNLARHETREQAKEAYGGWCEGFYVWYDRDSEEE